jgi:hypothetical protein
VRVGRGQYPGVQRVLFHFGTQGGKALGNQVHSGLLKKQYLKIISV